MNRKTKNLKRRTKRGGSNKSTIASSNPPTKPEILSTEDSSVKQEIASPVSEHNMSSKPPESSFDEKLNNHLSNSKKKLMETNEISKKVYEKMISRVKTILSESPPEQKCGRLKYLKKLMPDQTYIQVI